MSSEVESIPNQDSDPRIAADLNLVKAITAGSVAAWHEFLDRYSGVIYGVVRRHLTTEDEDEVRSVYVDILKSLYDGEIAKYRGDALLSTWLIVSSRRRSLDFFRKRYGRYHTPKGYDALSEFDKKVLQLYFIEKLPLEIVIHTFDWSGFSVSVDDIVESIQYIDKVMDRRYLNRLENERQARICGVDSVRMLKYQIQLRVEIEQKTSLNRPDGILIEKEVLETTKQLRTLISTLPPLERKALFFRFNRRWPAKKIAKKLDLNGQRRAYALIDKAIRKLREVLVIEGDR